MSTFGAVPLVFAMIGRYGVIAFMVHQRRQESASARRLAPRGNIGDWTLAALDAG